MEDSNRLVIAETNKRVWSFMIDDIVVAIFLIIIFYPQLTQIASDLPTVLTVSDIESFKEKINQFLYNNLYIIVSLKVLYHTFFVWQNGMTLGKYFMKIRVVEQNSMKTPTLLTALLRASIRIASEAFLYLGFLLAFFLPLKQTLHDKLSSCVVVDV